MALLIVLPELFIQYFDPVIDRQRGAAAHMHEATDVGGGNARGSA